MTTKPGMFETWTQAVACILFCVFFIAVVGCLIGWGLQTIGVI